MSSKNGAMIGATIAFLFYALLSTITPLEGKSVLPTAQVISDPVAKALYLNGLPASIIVFLSLEFVGVILGVIGYKILVESTTPAITQRTSMQKPIQKR